MLMLAGLGLNDEMDVPMKAIEAAKSADRVYCELYTGKWAGSLESLQSMIGKQVSVIGRASMEDGMRSILEEARFGNVLIFTQGDPMVATTHSAVLVEARKMGIETRIIHASSIFSAIGETGLHIYKFGATVTIPFMEKTGGRLPKSVYDTLRDNRLRGLHTLCLLDISADATGFMTPAQAVGIILGMERRFGEGAIPPSQKIVIFSRAGGRSELLYDEIETFHDEAFSMTPSFLVVPGNLHFTEEEYLDKFRRRESKEL